MLIALLIAALGISERQVSDPHLVPSNVTPFVVSNGRTTIAVWAMLRSNQPYTMRALLDRDGNVIDAASIWKGNWAVYGIATDGDRYLVAIDQQMALLLDENGKLIRRVAVTPNASAIASDGSTFAIVNRYAGVQLLDRDGNAIGDLISVPERILAIAGAGSGYLIVTANSLRTLQHGVLSSPIELPVGDASYAAVATNGDETIVALRFVDRVRVIPLAHGIAGPWNDIRATWGSRVGALWTGAQFIVWYDDDAGTNVAQFARDGAVSFAPARLSAESGAVAWNGSRLVFAGSTIARFAAEQSKPRVATDGEAMLVAWIEPYSTLRLSLVAADGSHTDVDHAITTGLGLFDSAAVAFDGAGWVIAYSSANGVALRRMTRDAVLSAETVLPSAAPPNSIRIASPGDGHFVVVWEAVVPPGDLNSGRTQASIDGGATIDIAPDVTSYSDVAWDGSVFRLVWMNWRWIWTTPPGYIHQYTTPVGLTFAQLNMKGELAIGETMQTRATGQPRVAGDLALFIDEQGVVVRRGGFDVPLNLWNWSSEPPGFASDDAGNAVIATGETEVLFSSDDRQSVLSLPGAGQPEVVHTRNGWVMVYTRIVDEPPYLHATRIFIRTLDFTPARRRR